MTGRPRRRDAVAPQVAKRADGVLGRVADDEAVRHVAHAGRGGGVEPLVRDAAAVELREQRPEPVRVGEALARRRDDVGLAALEHRLGLRELVIRALPESFTHAIGAGIGVLIAFIGLEWGGIIVDAPLYNVRFRGGRGQATLLDRGRTTAGPPALFESLPGLAAVCRVAVDIRNIDVGAARRNPKIVPVKRAGDPEDVAAAAVYLATVYPLAFWMTSLPREFNWFIANDFLPLPQIVERLQRSDLGDELRRSLEQQKDVIDQRQAAPDSAINPFDPADEASYNNATSVQVFDDKGQDVALTYYFQKASTDTWNVYVTANGSPVNVDGGGNPQPLTTMSFPPTLSIVTSEVVA